MNGLHNGRDRGIHFTPRPQVTQLRRRRVLCAVIVARGRRRTMRDARRYGSNIIIIVVIGAEYLMTRGPPDRDHPNPRGPGGGGGGGWQRPTCTGGGGLLALVHFYTLSSKRDFFPAIFGDFYIQSLYKFPRV